MQRLKLVLAIAFGLCGIPAQAGDVAKQSPSKAAATDALNTWKARAEAAPDAPAKSTPKALSKPETAAAKGGEAEPHKPDGTATKAAKPADSVPTRWSDAEISEAKARCNALLKTLDAVAIPETPFRSGGCGSPAPVRLVAIGRNPEVTLSPPPVLTCDMVAALASWIEKDVQPLARKHLGEPVIRIDTMSDYSCRTAYGRKGNRLSEHGRANALDIRGFVTARGHETNVLAEWGRTERDVRRDIVAARAAAEKAEKERAATAAANAASTSVPAERPVAAAAGSPATESRAPAAAAPDTLNDLAQSTLDALRDLASRTLVEGMPKPEPEDDSRAALAPPFRLGGPKETATAALPPGIPPAVATTRQGHFLRAAHAAACRIFGTTLGPEANEAHRNHLHIDMAVRKSGRHCE